MFKEKYGTLTKASTTQVTLSDSLVRVGGQWRRTGILTLSTASDLDTGAIAASSFYYVYVVVSSGILSLKASLSSQLPAGGLPYKKVGAFYTNGSSLVNKAYSFGDVNFVTLAARISGAAAIVSQPTPAFLTSASLGATGKFTIDFTAAGLAATPAFPGFLPNSSVPRMGAYTSPSATSVEIDVYTSGAAAVNDDFSFVIVKQGIDSVQPDWKDY